MKTTEFKVHAAYKKDDILKMQKVSNKKKRMISLAGTGIVFVLYVAVVLWEASRGEARPSLFSFIPGSTLDVILLAALAFSIVLTLIMPYLQTNKLMKSIPGGVLKANYYFYERTFQYGWGNSFETIGYVEIQEFVNLEEAFYIKAKDVSYWIKKADFEVGTPEAFLTFMQGKVKCKIK